MWSTLARPVRAARNDTEDPRLRNGYVLAIGEEGARGGGIAVLFCDESGQVTAVPLATTAWDAAAVRDWAYGEAPDPRMTREPVAAGTPLDDQQRNSWTGGASV